MQKIFVELIALFKRKIDMNELEFQSIVFHISSIIEIKKELVQKITQLSVEYTKYIKSKAYKGISELISNELMPLNQLIISNNSLEYFEEKIKKGEVIAGFRLRAAKELFVKSLDDVCKILFSCNEIERKFDTDAMLKRFEIEGWKKIRPFEFLISVLEKKYNLFRELLKTMHKQGKSKYIELKLSV